MRTIALRLSAAVAFAGLVVTPSPAAADARSVAARVTSGWTAAGASARALASRFVFDDETIVVPLPAAGPRDPACTHVAIVGARGASFHAKVSDASNDPLVVEPGARASSRAGVLELRRCDRPIRSVVVTSDAGRGALEIVVARSKGALPALGAVVPERTGGVLPPSPDAGALPPLPSVDKRAASAEARARRDGARVGSRTSLASNGEGAGQGDVELGPGCHRVEVFARDPRAATGAARGARARWRRARLDVDAELRDAEGDEIFARDRTEAPDGRLEACFGARTSATIVFAGAPPRSKVTVTVASWPLPARLPPLWGAATRSKMGRAMFARHVAVPAEDPVFLAQGASGTTSLPVPVEVGGCYVAVVGISHGRARALGIRATLGGRESSDERGAANGAALAAFCVRADERANVEVRARGVGVGWGLAVFHVKSGVWERGR